MELPWQSGGVACTALGRTQSIGLVSWPPAGWPLDGQVATGVMCTALLHPWPCTSVAALRLMYVVHPTKQSLSHHGTVLQLQG